MKSYDSRRAFATIALAAALAVVGCGKDQAPSSTAEPSKPAAASVPDQATTGRTIIVEAFSDADGNYFKPAKIEAQRGDVVRFVLKSGVHNINFLPDSNPGKTGLPASSDMLQLPDQTFDVKVSLANGTYYFQCDPHALLGMKGYLEVKD